MSNLHLSCFLVSDRPQLLQSVTVDLPSEALGFDLSSKFHDSLTIDDTDGRACAASGRLWETMLEIHRLPYILLRVADMRMTLGNKVSALVLYEELQQILENPALGGWIAQTRASCFEETDRQLFMYKNDPGFNASQRWLPTAIDAFPYCRLERKKIEDLRNLWQSLGASGDAQARFLNMHCLQTNYVEGIFNFSHSDNDTLVDCGFYDHSKLVDLRNPTGGAVRKLSDAISILQDTRDALSEIDSFLNSDPAELTIVSICRLHAQLMRTSQVLYSETRYGGRLFSSNMGVTRQISRTNVSIPSITIRGQAVKIQFCPYDDVEEELDLFCKRFNEIMRKDDIDPFACAAWISHVFVGIHPFEDGNGRMSRILSSIPLVRKGLPPLVVSATFKPTYVQNLNSTRSIPRDGDYQGLMEALYSTTASQLKLLESRI